MATGVESIPWLASAIATLRRDASMLFLASFLGLYFALAVIRYLSTEIRVFVYLKNLAQFFGIGPGIILADPRTTKKKIFPFFASVLFLLAAFASRMGLTHLPGTGRTFVPAGLPRCRYFVWAHLFPRI